MDKLDLKKQLKVAYKATVKPGFVEVPKLNALMIDGQGDPKNPDFRQAVEALYGLSYTMKFTLKKEEGLDWTVMGVS